MIHLALLYGTLGEQDLLILLLVLTVPFGLLELIMLSLIYKQANGPALMEEEREFP